MIDLNDEILIDFVAEAEDYYQTVQEAMDLLRRGQVSDGVAAMLRPLHTIKGTAGFIAGLEKLKTHTHQVEDIAKQLQAREQPPPPAVIEAVARAVDEVFNLLEQVRGGATELDDAEAQASVAALRQALDGRPARPSSRWFPPRVITAGAQRAEDKAQHGRVEARVQGGVVLVTVEMTRLHLAWQVEPLRQALDQADPRHPAAIDLSLVRTVSSTAWGEIWQASQGREVALIGLRPAVEATYLAWGLDSRIKAYAHLDDFWRGRTGEG